MVGGHVTRRLTRLIATLGLGQFQSWQVRLAVTRQMQNIE